MSVKVLVTPTVHRALDSLFRLAPKTAEEAARVKEFQPFPVGMTRKEFEERSKKSVKIRYHLSVRRRKK